MKKRTITMILAGAMLLTTPVFAQDMEDALAEQPILISAEVHNDVLQGRVTLDEIGEDYLLVTTGENIQIQLNINESTILIDSAAGNAIELADLKKGDELDIAYSAIMTRSLPGQTNAYMIAANVKEGGGVSLINVDETSLDEDGNLKVTDNAKNIVVTIAKDASVKPYKTKNIVKLDDIQKGSKILCWYDIMTMSIPAYASTDKVVIAEQADLSNIVISRPEEGVPFDPAFGVSHDIVISRPEEGVPFDPAFAVDPEFDLVINGQDLGKCDLPYYDGDTLMVPLRKISEALGYTVGWDAETGAITIEDANTQKATLFSRTKAVDIAGKLNIIDLSRKIENIKETVIKNGCTFVPVDFFKEFMNDVTVDGTKITVAAQKAELQ